MPIEEIKTKNLRWINITGASSLKSSEIKYLKTNFKFHPLNLKDCVIRGQRPKTDEYRDHLFLVLLFPYYNRKIKTIRSAEIDFFVGKNYIITVHDNQLNDIVMLYNHLKKSKNSREKNEFLSNNVIIILYNILNRIIMDRFPILDHISMDIHEIEKNMFAGKEKDMVQNVLNTRINIVNFRKAMQAHKNVLKKLEVANRNIKLFEPVKANIYFNSLIDKAKEIWDSLESFKESIDALHGTNESLISFRLNQIMKTFTSISVVIFVLTLVATLLGLGLNNTPLINLPFAFWIIILLEIIVATLVFSFFKRKKWLE